MDDDAPLEVASLSEAQAKRFLRRLRDLPFVALIYEGDRVYVYTKSVDPEAMRTIKQAVQEANEQEN